LLREVAEEPENARLQLLQDDTASYLAGNLQLYSLESYKKRLPFRVAFFSGACRWLTTLAHAYGLLALVLQAFTVALFHLLTGSITLLDALASLALPGIGESPGAVPVEAPAIQVPWVVPAIGLFGAEVGVLFLLVAFEDGGDVFGQPFVEWFTGVGAVDFQHLQGLLVRKVKGFDQSFGLSEGAAFGRESGCVKRRSAEGSHPGGAGLGLPLNLNGDASGGPGVCLG
jgi:hypothetical protein